MQQPQSGNGCKFRSWALAAIIGLLTALLLMALGKQGFIASVFLGLVAFVLLGLLFNWLFCAKMPEAGSGGSSDAGAKAAAPSTASAAPAKPAAEPAKQPAAASPAPAAEAASEAPADAEPAEDNADAAVAEAPAAAASDDGDSLVKPSTPLAGEAELASRKGSWKYEPEGSGASAAPAAAPAAETTPDYDGDGVREGTDEGTKPATLSAAREGGADNLKEIKGVGPKLEQMLNSMGFYHFDQIANWTADEIAWVDANLKGFKGRVSRDEWVKQAKILASGGETEFSKRVDDGDVY